MKRPQLYILAFAFLVLVFGSPSIARANCANPTAVEGKQVYNTTYHVMQYCDGTTWRGMGLPGGGGTCSNPTATEGKMIYNTTSHVMQFCNGTTWAAMGPPLTAPTSGLVGWWRFDESSGTTAADSSGNGSTGTLVADVSGLPTWNTPGKIGSGDLVFNGDNKVTIDGGGAQATPPVLQITHSFTVTAWINMSSVIPNDSDDWIMANFNDNVGTQYWSWLLKGSQDCTGVNLHDNLVLNLTPDGTTYGGPTMAAWCGTTVFQTNTWYFVAAVYDSSVPTVHLYVNGVDDSAVSYGSASTPASVYNAPGGIAIAGSVTGNPAFNGQIDDPRIYNRALSAAEIATLYAATGGSPGTCANPTGTTGKMIYNTTSHVMQFCNGNNWVSMKM